MFKTKKQSLISNIEKKFNELNVNFKKLETTHNAIMGHIYLETPILDAIYFYNLGLKEWRYKKNVLLFTGRVKDDAKPSLEDMREGLKVVMSYDKDEKRYVKHCEKDLYKIKYDEIKLEKVDPGLAKKLGVDQIISELTFLIRLFNGLYAISKRIYTHTYKLIPVIDEVIKLFDKSEDADGTSDKKLRTMKNKLSDIHNQVITIKSIIKNKKLIWIVNSKDVGEEDVGVVARIGKRIKALRTKINKETELFKV